MRITFLLGLLILTSVVSPAKPNILFAIADDWGLHAGAYGTTWVATPAFDRIAKEGILFKNAYTPNAKCAPSRASVLTGRYPWQLEEAGDYMAYFPAKFQSWPETLMQKGWHMCITGKGWGPGIAKDASGKTRNITGIPHGKRKLTPATSGIDSTDYAANFTDFLDATPEGKPWCFWYGSTEPHRDYEFGSGIKMGGKKLSDIDRVPAYWPDNEAGRTQLHKQMTALLKDQDDPRMSGKGELFDNYKPTINPCFYKRFMSGEKINTGWVSPGDFEHEPLD